ncbi:MAG: glutaredoxin [Deltaproteobacteria bacterium]|nr:MAG: glutaredoxin [Deltaproteobacteria bacterium]
MKKRRIEVFTAGCPLCEDAVQTVRNMACPDCEVIVYDLREGCGTDACREKAGDYGIQAVPAVVVDGVLADCCRERGIDPATLRTLGVGSTR